MRGRIGNAKYFANGFLDIGPVQIPDQNAIFAYHRQLPDPKFGKHGRGFHHYSGGDFEFIAKDPKGGRMEEWPEDIRIRQFPEVSNG